MKPCPDCGSTADARYAGIPTYCKACWRARVTARRSENIDEAREYDRARGNRQPPGYLAAYRADNAERYKANNAVNNAVRDGRLFKWPVCAMPECSTARVVGHHADYARPLDVVWLCQAHHKQAHELF